MRAMRMPFLLRRSQPVRVFSVTGTGTALTTARRMRATSDSSLQQRRAGEPVADFLGRTAHVDVDDLCARHRRCAARRPPSSAGSKPAICTTRGLGSPRVIHAPARFRRVPQPHIGGQHFRGGEPGAELAAQHAKRPVGHSGHRREHDVGAQHVGSDLAGSSWLRLRRSIARRSANFLSTPRRHTSISNPSASLPGSRMSSVASARSPGASMRAVGLAQIFRGLEIARADRAAEAIGERDAQQRIGLQLRRRVQDAGAHAQRAVGAWIAGDAPLTQLIRG